MANQRSLEIDVFRGLVLIFIVVDHISGSVLAWTTLRNFAIADATEVFVFLAGLVTAMAYTGLARRRVITCHVANRIALNRHNTIGQIDPMSIIKEAHPGFKGAVRYAAEIS